MVWFEPFWLDFGCSSTWFGSKQFDIYNDLIWSGLIVIMDENDLTI
jgi:hypothetical protein